MDASKLDIVMPNHSGIDRSQAHTGRPVVLFDGACPMCSREIAHYRRLPGADAVDWVDITSHPNLEGSFGIPHEQAMARFHVRDRDGHWHTGAQGFAELWTHLRGYRQLARAVTGLGLLPAMDRAYDRFARWRLRRQCDDGACTPRQPGG
jgi:predicted DCC family thiol-disulfide oxidoreductase YuxK